MLCRATLPASADRHWPWRQLSSPQRRKCVASDECELPDRGYVRGAGGNRNCRRGSCRRCHHPRPERQPETGRRRTAGNKNKGLAGTEPLSRNLISKTSVQTTTSGKRQFALILPSTSTSPISRQSPPRYDGTQNGQPGVIPLDHSKRIRTHTGCRPAHETRLAEKLALRMRVTSLSSFAIRPLRRCFPDCDARNKNDPSPRWR